MKFDLAPNPDPLSFGKGDDKFSLRLRPPTGEERAAILDAARTGLLVEMQNSVERLVIGWEGVVDPAGNPVPLQYKDGDITKKRLDAFLGAIDCKMQFLVLAGILAFVGVPTEDTDKIANALGDAEAKPDTAPTAPPDVPTTTSVSGG